MNDFIVSPKPFDKMIVVPTSKSYANRLLILAALNDRVVKISNLPKSTDVINLLNCLIEIGIKVEELDGYFFIHNSFPRCEKTTISEKISLSSGDGGTTNRFLMALLALGSKRYHLIPDPQILQRPFDELISALKYLGARIEKDDVGWMIQGPISLHNNAFAIDCSQTTQFASALLMLTSVDETFKVTTNNLKTSIGYFELTKEMIKQFVNGSDFEVPVDFSSMSYPLALALHSGKVTIYNCRYKDSFQPDSDFLHLLEEMGGNYSFGDNGLVVEKVQELRGMDFDCHRHPDLVPTLVFILAYANSKSKLSGLSELRFKETDRIENILKVLDLFKVPYDYDDIRFELTLFGNSPKVESVEFDCPQDHRIIMMAYLFMRVNNGGVLKNISSVSKSFPDFFTVME